jgi:hypothetical protein
MHKALAIYLLLKASCAGHLTFSTELRIEIMAALKMKTVRSFEKHLNMLFSANWVGRDKSNETYYIRSFKTLRLQHGFRSSTAVVFNIHSDAATITEFVQAAVINWEITRKVRGRNAVIRKHVGSSASIKEGAVQELIASGLVTPYCGLSNEIIGKLLGVSKSQGDRIKKRLVKLSYLKANAKYNTISILQKPDFAILWQLPTNRRYKVKKQKRRGKLSYIILERTYDEIISLMEFINQKSILRKLKKTVWARLN